MTYFTWVNRTSWTAQNLNTLTHWLLAMEYLQLSLALWRIKRSFMNRECHRCWSKSATWALQGFNLAIYGAIIGTWAWQMSRQTVDGKIEDRLWVLVDSITKVLAAVLLIVSVSLLRHQIDQIDNKRLVSRRKLIKVHSVVFLVFLAGYIGYQVPFWQISGLTTFPGWLYVCRTTIVITTFSIVNSVVNIATMVLFVHLSISFSQPAPMALIHVLLTGESQNGSSTVP